MTPKQQRFVQEYLIDLNATQAAIRAGYSKHTAHVIGQENLRKPAIAQAVEAAQAKLSEKTEITQETVIAGLLTEAERTEDGSSHGARVAAWTQLGKHLGMFKDILEHRGDPLAELFERITGNARARPSDDSPTIQ